MGRFKQLILDYMNIVISGSISSVSFLHRRFFIFPLRMVCEGNSLVVGYNCILWGRTASGTLGAFACPAGVLPSKPFPVLRGGGLCCLLTCPWHKAIPLFL